jgi:hypothetical protein
MSIFSNHSAIFETLPQNDGAQIREAKPAMSTGILDGLYAVRGLGKKRFWKYLALKQELQSRHNRLFDPGTAGLKFSQNHQNFHADDIR